MPRGKNLSLGAVSLLEDKLIDDVRFIPILRRSSSSLVILQTQRNYFEFLSFFTASRWRTGYRIDDQSSNRSMTRRSWRLGTQTLMRTFGANSHGGRSPTGRVIDHLYAALEQICRCDPYEYEP